MHNKKHRQLEYAIGHNTLSVECRHNEIFCSQVCVTFLLFYIKCDIYKHKNNNNNQIHKAESATTFCFVYSEISPKWTFKLFINFSEYMSQNITLQAKSFAYSRPSLA